MTTKTREELKVMRKGGKLLASVLTEIAEAAQPGVSLLDLERLAVGLIQKGGGKPSFKGYHGYPYATCLSVNDEIVHGMPRKYRLKEGDILGIDIGVDYWDLHTDSAMTVGIGRINAENHGLLTVTEESLWAGIQTVKPGAQLGDVQSTIQKHVEERGFTIVRDLTGHGIGRDLQEEPQIPNFGRRGTGPVLEPGQTFALEPMVTFRAAHTATKPDGWTVVTLDGKNAAHFEHTVAVTEEGVEVLTLRNGEKGRIQ